MEAENYIHCMRDSVPSRGAEQGWGRSKSGKSANSPPRAISHVESLPTKSGRFRKSRETILAAHGLSDPPTNAAPSKVHGEIDPAALVEMHTAFLNLLGNCQTRNRTDEADSPSPNGAEAVQHLRFPYVVKEEAVLSPVESDPDTVPPPEGEAETSSSRSTSPQVNSERLLQVAQASEIEADEAEVIEHNGRPSRLLFPCPHCAHRLVVKLKHHATICSCDSCEGVFRAPIFAKGSYRIVNQAYPFNHDRGRILMRKQMGTRRVRRQNLFTRWLLGPAAAAALIAMPLTLTSLGKLPESSRVLGAADGWALSLPAEPDYAAEATGVVQAYLAADGWKAKSAFVRDRQRVAPLMKDYYERQGHADGPQRYTYMHYSEVQLGLPTLTSHVSLEIDHQKVRGFSVEHLPDGPVIEWESQVIYNAMPWAEFRDQRPSDAHIFRIAAREASYYNYQFDNPETHLCIQLGFPGDLGMPVYGYAARDSDVGKRLTELLDGEAKYAWNPLVLDLQYPQGDQDHGSNQVQITDVVWDNWRLPAGGSMSR